VLRHKDNRKWYALLMKLSRRKFGFDSDEVIDVVNLKVSMELSCSFGVEDGVYPAYHMNKLHWVSVLLPDAPEDVVRFLVSVSFEITEKKTCVKNKWHERGVTKSIVTPQNLIRSKQRKGNFEKNESIVWIFLLYICKDKRDCLKGSRSG